MAETNGIALRLLAKLLASYEHDDHVIDKGSSKTSCKSLWVEDGKLRFVAHGGDDAAAGVLDFESVKGIELYQAGQLHAVVLLPGRESVVVLVAV